MSEVRFLPYLEAHGQRVAVKTPHTALTFAELAERVQVRVRELHSAGLKEGHAVVHVVPHSIETVVNCLALLEMSVFQVPASPQLTNSEGQQIIERVKAYALLREKELLPVATDAQRHSDAAVLGLLSSGSTGKPKLVLRTYEQILASTEIYRSAVSLTESDSVLAVLPLEHSYGFHYVLLATLRYGARLILSSVAHPRTVLSLVQNEGITLLPAAPVFFDLLARCGAPDCGPLPLRACVSVGTALSRRIYEAFTSVFDVPLWQSYGTSESGPVALNRTGTIHGEFLALGEVLPKVSVTIRDEEDHELPDGQVGEIVIESPAVSLGYDGAEVGTGTFNRSTFYTGDLGFIQDGILYFMGRKKMLIAAAGHKVDPLEVEQVLLRHPAVNDAAVVGEPDERGIEQIVAYVCTKGGVSHADVLSHCACHLAPHKVPRVIHFRATIPRNAMGKLQREKLR